jgi:hypothetical protein
MAAVGLGITVKLSVTEYRLNLLKQVRNCCFNVVLSHEVYGKALCKYRTVQTFTAVMVWMQCIVWNTISTNGSF